MTQSKTRLLALINGSNFPLHHLDDTNVQLLAPQPAAGGARYNTNVQVRAVTGQGYTGEREFFYRRIDLQDVGLVVLDTNGLATAQELLDQLNSQYATFLDLADLEEFVLPELTDEAGELTLQARADSLGWTGSLVVQLSPLQAV